MMKLLLHGYSGAPRGRENCVDLGFCSKKKFFPNVRHAGYDACRSVHAEQNALISGSRREMLGATLYLVQYRTDTGEYEENRAGYCTKNRKGISCYSCVRMGKTRRFITRKNNLLILQKIGVKHEIYSTYMDARIKNITLYCYFNN